MITRFVSWLVTKYPRKYAKVFANQLNEAYAEINYLNGELLKMECRLRYALDCKHELQDRLNGN